MSANDTIVDVSEELEDKAVWILEFFAKFIII